VSTVSKEKRAQIANQVRALLQKTAGNGCTEAEAMAAAEKAGQLMTAYALAAEDIEDIKDEKFGFRRRPGYAWQKGMRCHYHEVLKCVWGVAHFFDCKVYYRTDTTELSYFGTELDTLLAHTITQRLKDAIELEWKLFKKLPAFKIEQLKGIHPKTMHAQFAAAFAYRVTQRFKQMKGTQVAAITQSSHARALVVCKEGIVNERFEQAHPGKIRTRKTKTVVRQYSHSAVIAGEAAGGNVSLETNVERPSEQHKRIA
jgi:hypothetical protein